MATIVLMLEPLANACPLANWHGLWSLGSSRWSIVPVHLINSQTGMPIDQRAGPLVNWLSIAIRQWACIGVLSKCLSRTQKILITPRMSHHVHAKALSSLMFFFFELFCIQKSSFDAWASMDRSVLLSQEVERVHCAWEDQEIFYR